ncbi:MAG: sulfite exporter TauE/SafE family protein [Chloroflexi bacterium]|nr:sulfite exporter TauE/SafE family protein [Chloroflexota bacterium]
MLPPVVLPFVGMTVAGIGTLIGSGGGFMLVPLLALLDPALPTASLTAISIGVVVFTGASGTVAYVRQGRVDTVSAVPLALATIPGGVAGALLTRGIARGTFDLLFAALLLGLAAFLFMRKPVPASVPIAAPGWGVFDRSLTDAAGNRYRYRVNLPVAILIALVEGLVVSLFGVGGGFLMVPVLVGILRFPPHVATATSTFMVLITALASTLTHLGGDKLAGHVPTVALLGVGAVVGAQIGARYSRRVGGPALVRAVSLVLVTVGIGLAAQAVLR